MYKNNEGVSFSVIMGGRNVFIYIHNIYMYVQRRACYEGGKKKGKNGKDKI